MNFITYNNQNFTNGIKAVAAVCKNEGKKAAEKFYNEVIFQTPFCLRCAITNRRLTYRTYKRYGYRCGSTVYQLYLKHKDKNIIKKILKKDYFYVEELNGYFSEWVRMSVSANSLKLTQLQKKFLYDKYILNSTKCRLTGCNEKVPFEQVRFNSCCKLHYSRDINLKRGSYTTEDLKYECKIDGEKFPRLNKLTFHIKNKGWNEENYYKTFIDPNATGTCKWCSKQVPFVNVDKGYRNFCHNTSCNVLWHNKFENRNDNGEKISRRQKESQNMPNQKGYWLKRGYAEEEAIKKVKERQTTNSVEAIMKRKNCSREEAVEIRKEITKKWSKSFPDINYSLVSQKLFWSLYEIVKDKFPEIYFATLNPITKQKDETGKNHEFRLKTKKSFRRPDFFIPCLNKIIEFDGDYWHSENCKGKKRCDIKRDNEITEALNNCKILHVKEDLYNKDPKQIINQCLSFILNE